MSPIDLTKTSEEELLELTGLTLKEHQEIEAWLGKKDARQNIRFLKNGVTFYPTDYDPEAVIMNQFDERGEKMRDFLSVKIGFHIGYQEGFRIAAKSACDAIDVLNE